MYEINAMALAYLRALLFVLCVCVQQETQFTNLHRINFDIVADL